MLRSAAILLLCLYALHSGAQTYNHLYLVSKRGQNYGEKTTYGYINDSSRLAIGYKFSSADKFVDGRARAMTSDRKWGIIDTQGNWVVPPAYTDLLYSETDHYWTAKIYPDSLVVLDRDGRVICQGYGEMVLYSEPLNRIIFDSRSGDEHKPAADIFDYSGKKIKEFHVPANNVLQLSFIDQGLVEKNKKSLRVDRGSPASRAVADTNGNMLIDSADGVGFYYGYMILNGPHKAGVIDTNLRELIPFSAGYEVIQRMENAPMTCFNVKKNGKWRIIDINMHPVTNLVFDDRIWQQNKDMFIVYGSNTRLYTAYTYDGQKLFESRDAVQTMNTPTRFPVPMKLSDTVYQLWKGKNIGPKHEFISAFNDEGYAYCYDKGVKTIVDTNGKAVFTTRSAALTLPQNGIMGAGSYIPCPACGQYNCAPLFASASESHATVYHYIDLNGKRLFNDTFERISPFRNGQASVVKNCQRYYIDSRGRKLPANGSFAIAGGRASGMVIAVNKDMEQALMDSTGKIVSPWVTSFKQKEGGVYAYHFFETDRGMTGDILTEMLPDFNHGMILFSKKDQWGIMDSTGKIIVEPLYHSIDDKIPGYYIARTNDDQQGILDAHGNILVQPLYSNIEYNYNSRIFILEKSRNEIPVVFIPAR